MPAEKDVLERLKEALREDDNVLLAYLFGSRARGEASPISDYDVAVLLKDSGLQAFAEVLSSISKTLGVCEDKIDILDLARAPLHLKAKVLSEGILIIDRGYDDTLRLEVNTRYPEVAYQTRVLLRKWLDNPVGLDLRVIKERIDYLTQLNDNIKSFFGKHKPGDVSTDFEAWFALKGIVQDSIQAIIDICAHIFSSKNLGVAESYRDYVEKLSEHGYISGELAKELKLAIAMRNRLIHRYLAVEPIELWDFAVRLSIEIIPRFRDWILKSMHTCEGR
ncbi:MAG: DUF86 domain-containing protein [Nitrososphaerota archaeon]|nr:DUF86 domain-containing protein [Nitrososphaerota archaeon]